ncbi:hypothetical protein ACFLTP_08305, partial [Chloroflexota bacterium]
TLRFASSLCPLEKHLLVSAVRPQEEHISNRLLKLRNIMKLLQLLELKKTPEEQRKIIDELFERAKTAGKA